MSLHNLIDSELLNKIDALKENIEGAGLDECLNRILMNIEEMTNEQSSHMEVDNVSEDILPNFIKALNYSRAKYQGEFSIPLMQEVAAILDPRQKRPLANYADFRKSSVKLRSMDYIAPPSNKILWELNKVISFMEKIPLHPLEEASLLYLHIVRIQPFEIANKRNATIMMDTILNFHGYPSISVNNGDKHKFLDVLAKAIAGYRKDMSQGADEISYSVIGSEQKEFFNFFADKMYKQVSNIGSKLSHLDKYIITINTKYPQKEFAMKKTLLNYFSKTQVKEPYQIKLSRNKHTLEVTGRISQESLNSLLAPYRRKDGNPIYRIDKDTRVIFYNSQGK